MSAFETYEDLLVATDGGELARAATRHALALAAAFDARIHALSVVNTSVAGDYPSKRAASADAIASVANSAADVGIECSTAVREGTQPYAEITEYRREHDIDLVTMGTHGRSGVRRYLLGSVAERVVRAAHVPVLAVPPSEAADRSPTYGSILLPIDESEAAESAIRHGLGIADRFEAVVHTLHASEAWEPDSSSAGDTEIRSVDRTLTAVTDRAQAASLRAEDHRYTGDAVDAIEGAISRHDVDLVAIGTHGESSVKRLVLGSTTDRVLRRVHVPVLAVPPLED